MDEPELNKFEHAIAYFLLFLAWLVVVFFGFYGSFVFPLDLK